MRIHSKIENSSVNGPGRRAVIWFQGCRGMTCAKDCWNKDTHDPARGHYRSIRELVDWIGYCLREHLIEGLTLSGGEPCQQAIELGDLIAAIRERFPNLSIGMFSGYSEKELDEGKYNADEFWAGDEKAWWKKIRSGLDWAVLGRFNRLAPSSDPLVTSTNQRLRLFTDRYTATDFQEQAVEVSINADGLFSISGFPTKGELNA